jgi:hypothetical protein
LEGTLGDVVDKLGDFRDGQDCLKKVEQFISKVCIQEDINLKELKSGSRRGNKIQIL